MTKRKLLAALTAAILVPSVALADPNVGEAFPLTCGSEVLMISVNGNGQYSPAHVIGSTTVLHPVTFVFEVTVNGQPAPDQTSTSMLSGGNGKMLGRGETITCTFTDSFTDQNGNDIIVNGTVTGYASPAKQAP